MWIESHQELARHPKLLKFSRLLNICPPQGIGHLHCLWWWAVSYATDGDLTAFEERDIAEASQWTGDPSEFYTALRVTGFVDANEGRVTLHDWDDYAGALLDRIERNRVHARERMRRMRARETSTIEIKRKVTAPAEPPQHDVTRNTSEPLRAVTLLPNLTIPNQTKTTTKTKTPALTRGFVRPSAEEVREFSDLTNLNDHSAEFVDYYEANGWRVGKNPMKDWRAAYRNWCRRDFGGNHNQRPLTYDEDVAAIAARLRARGIK